MLDAVRQGVAGQFDDALVAFGVLALVDREGEIAGAQQRRHRGIRARIGAGQPLGVELGVAAHVAGAGDVGHHQRDRAVALGLEREDALVLEAPARVMASVMVSPSSWATGSG